MGQRILGVQWDVPNDFGTASKQLEAFQQSGISILEVNEKLSPDILKQIQQKGFSLFVNSPFKFLTVRDLSSDSTFLQVNREYIDYYMSYTPDLVRAFGLFSYGQTDSPDFLNEIISVQNQLKSQTSAYLYYTTIPGIYEPRSDVADFKLFRINETTPQLNGEAAGYIYLPRRPGNFKLRNFKSIMELTSAYPKKPVFLDAQWLLHNIKSHPQLPGILTQYTRKQEAVFSIPAPEASPVDPNWIVLFLVLVWGSFAVHYSFVPVYRKSLTRYFLMHHFFVEDIMEWRIRTTWPGVYILIQNAVLGGICIYAFVKKFYSPLGLEALYHHYPILGIFGKWPITLLFIGFSLVLVFEIICVLWLYFLNTSVKHLSQIIILYSWPLQFNLISVTVLTTLILAQSDSNIIYFLGFLYFFILFSSFFITAVDTSNFIRGRKDWFLLGTVGLQIVLIIITGFLIYQATSFIDVIDLALLLH